MKRFNTRKSFRLDADTSSLLEEVARQCFGKESTLIRKYVQAGLLEDAERYAEQTKKVLEAMNTLRQVHKAYNR